jgi:integrase/recombinase XerD
MAGGELMINAVNTYLSMRRTAGYVLSNTEYLLRSYANFAADCQETHIRMATAIHWASKAKSIEQRHTRYETVRRFSEYVCLEDSQHEWLPANHFGYRKIRRVPRIYSPHEIQRLVLTASQLESLDSLTPHTYVTLISLLAATGMRISEALGLLISDITPKGLLIRKTKFQKTRLVPLHATAFAGIRRYLTRRKKVNFVDEHLFLSRKGHPLRYPEAHEMFRKLLKLANLQPLNGRLPRLHELRHTFAVRALESSPAGRKRIGQHMLALATYLGHVNINATYWYLESTPVLLRDIATESENFMCGGQP